MQDVVHEATTSEVAARLAAVTDRIRAAEAAAGRAPGSVALVAVSKGHAAPLARAALDAGHRLFGENRVQEAKAKWPALREAFADCRLRLIGPLQTNKVKEAVALFDAVETVDRPRLAQALAASWALSTGQVARSCGGGSPRLSSRAVAAHAATAPR